MTEHTPGPWMMAAKASSIVGWPVVAPRAEGRVVCSLNYADPAAFAGRMPGDGAFNKESRANGLLIAAAPDLLRSAEEMLEAMVRYQMDVDDEPPMRHREMMSRTRAAIAKARGEVA